MKLFTFIDPKNEKRIRVIITENLAKAVELLESDNTQYHLRWGKYHNEIWHTENNCHIWNIYEENFQENTVYAVIG